MSVVMAATLDAAVVVCVCLSAGLLVLYVGFPLLTFSLELASHVAAFERRRVDAFVGVRIPDPHLGALSAERGRLADPVSWKEAAYAFSALVVGPLACGMVLGVWAVGLGLVAFPAYAWALPPHQGWWSPSDAPVWATLAAAGFGVVVFVAVAPRVVLGVTSIQRWLAVRLLGPSPRRALEQRVDELVESRDRSVDTAAAERRRIERDLHDGAQQRLVSLAMDLGVAKEKFDADPEAARALVEGAHAEAKRALVELRDLARGIHPAVLADGGLDGALSALASRSAVPVDVTVELAGRPPERIEAVAYFVVAEALVNVGRHAHATGATVMVVRRDERLTIEVRDDGVGGADAAAGSGLAGLADRVASVDGWMKVMSPPGGPTSVLVELPCGS